MPRPHVLFALAIGLTALAGDQVMPVVPRIDINRYAGTWYEIARLPNRFEKDCASDISALYTTRPDEKIGVVNTCTGSNGKKKQSKGTARVADRNGPNSKFRVSFFWPFSGEYWILDLDKSYKWALVGAPDRKYLWILSRGHDLNPQTYNRIVSKARSLGFDTRQLIRVKHSA